MSLSNSDIKFILIDDNPIDLFIAERIIKSIQPEAHIHKFTEASKALKHLKEEEETINSRVFILLDIYMPGMDGFDFLEQYDSQISVSSKQHIHVIVLSSSTNQFDVARAKGNVNVYVMLQKPLTKDSLLPLLQIQS